MPTRLVVSAVLFLCATACGPELAGVDSGLSHPLDAGATGGGAPLDGGVDGGPARDGGVSSDAGGDVDAGGALDAGADLDAGTAPDAGTPSDAGSSVAASDGGLCAGGAAFTFCVSAVVVHPGDALSVSGDAPPGASVTVRLWNPSGGLVSVAQPQSDGGTYRRAVTTFPTAPTVTFPEGVYRVDGTLSGSTLVKDVTFLADAGP